MTFQRSINRLLQLKGELMEVREAIYRTRAGLLKVEQEGDQATFNGDKDTEALKRLEAEGIWLSLIRSKRQESFLKKRLAEANERVLVFMREATVEA